MNHPRHTGLPQGVVNFGTMYHEVLVFMHTHGDVRRCEVAEELNVSGDQASAILQRLCDNGFIFRKERPSIYDDPSGKARQWVYTLKKVKPKDAPRATHAERTRAHRARKSIKVPSVFEFRGVISL